MKPNDEAYAAAIKIYNIHSDYDAEAVSLRLAVDAAYAAQFQSEDYAGLIERLRKVEPDLPGDRTRWHRNPDGPDAADALEAVLAERKSLTAAVLLSERQNELLTGGINRLRADLAAVTTERDRLQILHDEAYIAGMKHGWNCCAAGDEERYKRTVENTREQIRRARAALEGVTEKLGAGNE